MDSELEIILERDGATKAERAVAPRFRKQLEEIDTAWATGELTPVEARMRYREIAREVTRHAFA